MRNKLGDDTGVIFGELVARTKSLRQLNLGENRLGPKTLIAIGRGLAQNSSLQSVGLEHNDLTSDGFNFDGVNQFAEVDPILVIRASVPCQVFVTQLSISGL